MRWFIPLLLIALTALPGSAQVAAVDGPIQPTPLGPTPLAPAPFAPAPDATTDAPGLFTPASAANLDPNLRLEVDYLYWFLRRMTTPPLLTTGTPNAAGVVGAVGDPGTTVLYGGPIDTRFGRAIGVQLRATWWIDDEQTFGVHGTAFFLERDSSNFTVPHGTITPLARPFLDASSLTQQSTIIGGNIPNFGVGLGGFNAYTNTELYGQDINLLTALVDTPRAKLGLLLGGRFLQMRERLDITATTKVGPNLDSVLGETDHLHTSNQFFGLQAGVLGDLLLLERLSLSGKATLALGDDHQGVNNSGDRIIDTPGTGRLVFPYGLYVLPSNSGTFRQEAFNMVFETSVTLNYQLTGHIALRLGYSYLGWQKPIRPGQQITQINPSQGTPTGLIGPDEPHVPFNGSWFWVQGGTAGLEFRW